MIANPLDKTGVTLDDLLQHEGRAEVYDGELVEMSASGITHNILITNIWRVFDEYVQKNPIGLAFGDGATYLMFSPYPRLKNSFEPDVSVLFHTNIPAGWDATKPHPGAPDFAVEVISPDDRAKDVQYKQRTYLEKGTRQVWLVYPATQEVHVFNADGAQVYKTDNSIDVSVLFPGLAPIPVGAIFMLPEWAIKQASPKTE